MRHAIRYLPAFLALLLPLAVLAFLGSRELSRQRDRAETFLRERAFDLTITAVRRFDDEIEAFCDTLLDRLDTTAGDLATAASRYRDAHPEVAELLVLESDGDLIHPRPAPLPSLSSYPSSRHLRIGQALLARGDARGAIAYLESAATGALDDGGGRGPDALSLARCRVQLAGIHRGLGEKERALEIFTDTLAQLPAPSGQRDRRRGRSRRRPRADRATTELFCRAGRAELRLELHADRSDLVDLVESLGVGELSHPDDDALHAVLERATALLGDDGPAVEALGAARLRLAALSAGHRRARDYQRFVQLRLRDQLRRADPTERIHHVFDPGLATYLLVLRAVRPEESELYAGSWVGFQLDLTAFANRVLAPLLVPRDDGFHLDIATPMGARVLRHPLPEGADDWDSEVLSRSTVAGLQFQAIPRNARQQLQSRRASARNRALLVLALCLVAGGGAFFLVRSVGREAELATMKVDLVSRVSHELKTPLAMIKMYGDTLSLGRTRSPEDTARFASIISREADRLTLWIDRILDFSKHQGGEVQYHREYVDLAGLVEHVIEEYRPHVEAAGAAVTADLADDLSVRVDRGSMESAVVNLLENAVKYTPGSAPERTVEIVARRDGDFAVLEVLDRGVGIPADEQTKVFDSFYRASSAGEVRGAGLGLSLVRRFVLAHGGSVEACSRPGGGTIVRLRLPLTTPRQSSEP